MWFNNSPPDDQAPQEMPVEKDASASNGVERAGTFSGHLLRFFFWTHLWGKRQRIEVEDSVTASGTTASELDSVTASDLVAPDTGT